MAIAQRLPSHSYGLNTFTDKAAFINCVQQDSQAIDCLVMEHSISASDVFSQLTNLVTLLPAVIIDQSPRDSALSSPGDASIPAPPPLPSTHEMESTAAAASDNSPRKAAGIYHSAIIELSADQLDQLPAFIDRSIVQFLKLPLAELFSPLSGQQIQRQESEVLQRKQRALSQKLRERLGYLGVYYKRDPVNFLRHMELDDKKAFIARLKQDYREIVLRYFAGDTSLNQKIDAYVNTIFFADVSVAQVVEIHMDLMDDFSKQLQIEGRSEEILLDYRLTLIDLLANLCEMYRRSISRDP